MRGYEATAWRAEASVRKTMNGTGMVEPTKSVTVTYDSGRSEVLKAGLTRLAANHPLVKQMPSLFRPCDSTDKATVVRLRELAQTRTRVLGQTTRAQRPRARARAPASASASRTLSVRRAVHPLWGPCREQISLPIFVFRFSPS